MRLLPNVIKASEYVSIKNGNAFPSNNMTLQDLSDRPLTDQDAQNQHRKIVSHAFEKAQQIMEAAQTYSLNKVKESTQRMNEEAAQLLVQSHEEGYRRGLTEGQKGGSELGYRDGYQDGLEKAKEEGSAALEELSNMLQTVETMKSEVLQKFEDDIQKLAVAIAEKIIKRELSIDEKAMQSIILNALDSYRNQAWVRIYVSKPAHSMLVHADNSIIQALRDVSENIKIEVSPEMNDGDCKIEMPDQMIDAGVDTQMEKIKRELQI